jgi:hypothetical protein
MKLYSFFVIPVLVTVFIFSGQSLCRAEYFNGDKLVDRYQLAIVFSRIAFFTGQVPEGLSTRELPFADVPKVYMRPVGTVTSLGVMSAVEDKFDGTRFVTRYELGRAVTKLCETITVSRGPVNSHLIPSDVSVFHRNRESAEHNSTQRLLEPASGKYRGNHYVSRYEFAGICARLARHFSLKTYSDVELHLDDVEPGHWARADVEYACSTGILNTRGVGVKASHRLDPVNKTEHISKYNRRRDTVHGSFGSEFSHGTFEAQSQDL